MDRPPHRVAPRAGWPDRSWRPLGARIIAATNRDLEEEVAAKRFCEDLLFRIQIVRIEVPPLRTRGNDILLLARHFLRTAAQEVGRGIAGLSHEAGARLLDYPWPGNVRELQNCIERAVALYERREILTEDLPERIRRYQGSWPPVGAGAVGRIVSLEAAERRHILQVLEAVSGNKSRAARILGLDRKTLYRKLEWT